MRCVVVIVVVDGVDRGSRFLLVPRRRQTTPISVDADADAAVPAHPVARSGHHLPGQRYCHRSIDDDGGEEWNHPTSSSSSSSSFSSHSSPRPPSSYSRHRPRRRRHRRRRYPPNPIRRHPPSSSSCPFRHRRPRHSASSIRTCTSPPRVGSSSALPRQAAPVPRPVVRSGRWDGPIRSGRRTRRPQPRAGDRRPIQARDVGLAPDACMLVGRVRI